MAVAALYHVQAIILPPMAEPDKVACQGKEKVFTLVKLFMASMTPYL